MSEINYDIWGTPDTWTHWSASTTPTIETVYGQYRSGAASWSDADFDNYPYFKINPVVNLRNLVVSSDISLNEPLDNTLAYTAIAGTDLPQYNRYVFNSVHYSADDYIAVSNRSPVPFSLAYYYRNDNSVTTPCRYGNIYGFDGFPNNVAILDVGKMQRYAPFAAYDDVYTNVWGDYNPILRIAPVIDFGIRSVILVIHVGYIDTGTTMATASLKSYLQHTDAWLQEHPVVMAYCVPYFRTDTAGNYTTSLTGASIRFTGICPVFYNSFRDRSDTYDIYNYLSTFNFSGGSGCFPIFGAIHRDSFNTSITVSVSRVADSSMTKTNLSQYAVFYGADKAEIHYTGNDSSGTIYGTIDMSVPENIEYIMKGAAAYGLFFCTDIGTLGNSGRDSDRWVDNNMYLGIIRSDGMTYGEYSHGLDNAEQQQYDWKSSTETPYVPGQNTNIYSQQTRIKAIGHIDTMTKRYVLDSNAIQAMAVDMFAIMSDLSEQGTNWGDLMSKSLDAFLVQNPIDCIVSLKKYPVKNIPKDNTLVNIQYGRYTSGSAAAYECLADVYTYAFTPREIQPRFGGSFLDYEPYTSAELFIPYCGTVQLRMCDILGKTLQPFICVDYYTGQCTGFIMCDGIVIETIQGTIAVDVPVTGIQTATIEGQLQNAANISRQARVNQFAQYTKSGLIVAAATVAHPVAGAAALATQIKGIMNTWLQTNQADYNLTHTEAPQHIIGTSSSACSWIIDADTARLILYYPGGGVIDDDLPPNFDDAALAEFISLNGVATIETGQIKNYPGVTSGCKPMLTGITTENGIPASDEELKLIEDAIFEGLIVPVS